MENMEAEKVHYIVFSSHMPSVEEHILDTGVADMMMFSINPAYDLEQGDAMAANHYEKLRVKADACIGCGHCDNRCPFHTAQSARMKEIATYFAK